jgi:hypothetical protein
MPFKEQKTKNMTFFRVDPYHELCDRTLSNILQEWTPDGSRVKAFVNDDGTFGLLFESTEADDKGTFTAIAFSDEGMARSNANVAIKTRLKEGVAKSAPTFGRPLGDVAVDEGQKLRITTPVKGNPIPEFWWTKDGQTLSGDRIHSFSDGELV